MLCAPGYKLSTSEIVAPNPGVQKKPLKVEKNQVIAEFLKKCNQLKLGNVRK